MTIVNGQLSDFGLAVIADQRPQIIFRPSGPAVTGTRVMVTEPIIAVPQYDTGSFSINLAPTEGLRPDTWYEVSIRWLPREEEYVDSNWTQHDLVAAKVRVPDTTFISLADALEVPGGPDMIWLGSTPPPGPVPFTKWLNTTTGDLSEWR